MTPIHIRVLRHSAFYSPLLLSISGGFLEQQGLTAHYDIATPERTVEAGIACGEVHVAQSAVAASFAALAHDGGCPLRHFAQINERDGFFITTRKPLTKPFDWQQLAQGPVLVDHFFQPLAMLRYALHLQGIELESLDVRDAGSVEQIDAAYRAGQGDFVHQQGPFAQQLEADGLGQVVACVGEVLGPVAFSSLCTAPDWLQTEMAQAFMAAYLQGRRASCDWPAAEVARHLGGFFPAIAPAVLTSTVQAYQDLGCWSGGAEITPAAFERALDIFEYSGDLSRRFAYAELICAPPGVAGSD